MPRAKLSGKDALRAEIAGGVVLHVLRELPKSGAAKYLYDLLHLALIDPDERALFDLYGPHDLDDGGVTATTPRSPVLSGGAAVDAYAP